MRKLCAWIAAYGVNPAEHPAQAIAAFEASADALRIEFRGEVIAGEGEPVSRHPVVGEGEGRREIGRAGTGGAVHAGLEGVALAATQTLRQAPIGAAAGEGKAHHRIGRQAIVEAAGDAHRARGHIVAADNGKVAAGAVAASIRPAPCGPVRLIDRRQRFLRCFEYRGIGERDLRWRRVSRSGAKPSAGCSPPATPLRPSTKGSSIRLRNWSVSWKPTRCAPVAASPESW